MNDYADDRWHPKGRCSGHCCRMITLSATPERIAMMAAGNAYMRRMWDNYAHLSDVPMRWTPPDVDRNPDGDFVTRNFVFVRNSYVDGITGERTWSTDKSGAKPVPQYRCTAWSGTDCTKYDERPWLCRHYGSPKRPCKVEGCRLRWAYRDPVARWDDDGGRQASDAEPAGIEVSP